jgi:hypothetical protein
MVAADSTTVCDVTAVTGATGLAVPVAGPVPAALAAATVTAYIAAAGVKSPADRLTLAAEARADADCGLDPGAGTQPSPLAAGTTCCQVIVKPLTASPPSSAGAAHDTVTAPVPSGLAVTCPGPAGGCAVCGVPDPVAAAEVPTAFDAVNVSV